MLKKIICFLWGHKTVHKAYTGKQMSCVSMIGVEYTINMFNYKKTPFCTRCGEDVESNPSTQNHKGEQHDSTKDKKHDDKHIKLETLNVL